MAVIAQFGGDKFAPSSHASGELAPGVKNEYRRSPGKMLARAATPRARTADGNSQSPMSSNSSSPPRNASLANTRRSPKLNTPPEHSQLM